MWLAEWLLKYSHLAHDTKCFYESKAQDIDMFKLSENDLGCQSKMKL